MKAVIANTDAIVERIAVIDNTIINFLNKEVAQHRLAVRDYDIRGYNIVMGKFIVVRPLGCYAFLMSTVYD